MKASYTNQPDYDMSFLVTKKPWKARFYRESSHGYFRFFHGDAGQLHRKPKGGILWVTLPLGTIRGIFTRIVEEFTHILCRTKAVSTSLFMAEIWCIPLFTCFCTWGLAGLQPSTVPLESIQRNVPKAFPSSKQSVLQETVVTSRTSVYIALKKSSWLKEVSD